MVADRARSRKPTIIFIDLQREKRGSNCERPDYLFVSEKSEKPQFVAERLRSISK